MFVVWIKHFCTYTYRIVPSTKSNKLTNMMHMIHRCENPTNCMIVVFWGNHRYSHQPYSINFDGSIHTHNVYLCKHIDIDSILYLYVSIDVFLSIYLSACLSGNLYIIIIIINIIIITTYIYIYICLSIYRSVYLSNYLYVYLCICISAYVHIYIYTYTYIYIYTYIIVYIYIYI